MAGEEQIGGIALGLGLDLSGFSAGIAKARSELETLQSVTPRVNVAIPRNQLAAARQQLSSQLTFAPSLAVHPNAIRGFRAGITGAFAGKGAIEVPVTLGRVNWTQLRSQIAAGIGAVPIRVELDPSTKGAPVNVVAATVARSTGSTFTQSRMAVKTAATRAGIPVKGAGGPVARQQMVLVGDQGPEYFAPDRPGRIVARHDPITRGLSERRLPIDWDDRNAYDEELEAFRERKALGGRVRRRSSHVGGDVSTMGKVAFRSAMFSSRNYAKQYERFERMDPEAARWAWEVENGLREDPGYDTRFMARGGFIRRAYEQTLENEGGTFDKYGRQPGRGYAVAYGQGPIVPKDDPGAFARAFHKVYRQAAKSPYAPFVGTWGPKDADWIQLDTSTVEGQRAKAMRLALREAQLAGFDLSRFEEIVPKWSARYPSPGQLKLPGFATGGQVEAFGALFPNAKIDLSPFSNKAAAELLEAAGPLAERFPITAQALRGIGFGDTKRSRSSTLIAQTVSSPWDKPTGSHASYGSRILFQKRAARLEKLSGILSGLVDPSLAGVFRHEFGHAVDFTHGTSLRYRTGDILPSAISKYAAGSVQEKFAELFAAIEGGRDIGDFRASIDAVSDLERRGKVLGVDVPIRPGPLSNSRAQGGAVKRGGLPRGLKAEMWMMKGEPGPYLPLTNLNEVNTSFMERVSKPGFYNVGKQRVPGSFSVIVRNREGDVVASAPFTPRGGEEGVGLHPELTWVHPDYWRRGIASSMYARAERFAGAPVMPSGIQTEFGKALWSQSQRSFGKRYGERPVTDPDVLHLLKRAETDPLIKERWKPVKRNPANPLQRLTLMPTQEFIPKIDEKGNVVGKVKDDTEEISLGDDPALEHMIRTRQQSRSGLLGRFIHRWMGGYAARGIASTGGEKMMGFSPTAGLGGPRDRFNLSAAEHLFPGVRDALRVSIGNADPETISKALAWYRLNGERIAEIAASRGVTPETLASGVASFSQNSPWPGNLFYAVSFLDKLARGEEPTQMSGIFASNKSRASFATALRGEVAHPFDVLTGPKDLPFAKALTGVPDAQAIDRMVARAAGLDKDVLPPAAREAVDRALREISGERGWEPRGTQAVAWYQGGGGKLETVREEAKLAEYLRAHPVGGYRATGGDVWSMLTRPSARSSAIEHLNRRYGELAEMMRGSAGEWLTGLLGRASDAELSAGEDPDLDRLMSRFVPKEPGLARRFRDRMAFGQLERKVPWSVRSRGEPMSYEEYQKLGAAASYLPNFDALMRSAKPGQQDLWDLSLHKKIDPRSLPLVDPHRYFSSNAMGGPQQGRGLYIVGERGEELFVPRRKAHIIPPDVMDQIPKRSQGGDVQRIGVGGEQFFEPPEDGIIIPNHLRWRVKRAAAGDNPIQYVGQPGLAVSLAGTMAQALRAELQRSTEFQRRVALFGPEVASEPVVTQRTPPGPLRTLREDSVSSLVEAIRGAPGKVSASTKRAIGQASVEDLYGEIAGSTAGAQRALPAAASLRGAVSRVFSYEFGGGKALAEAQAQQRTAATRFTQELRASEEPIRNHALATASLNAQYRAGAISEREYTKGQELINNAFKAATPHLQEARNELDKANKTVSSLSDKGSAIRNLASIAGGIGAYQAFFGAISLGTPVVSRMVDTLTGFQGTSDRITSSLAEQTRSLHGNAEAAVAATAANAGLSKSATDFVSSSLKGAAFAKAGAQAQAEASDLFRATTFRGAGGGGAFAQAATPGLFGGYGGVGGGSFLAEFLGGGKGLEESLAQDFSQFSRMSQRAGVAATPGSAGSAGMGNFSAQMGQPPAGYNEQTEAGARALKAMKTETDDLNEAFQRGQGALGDTTAGLHLVSKATTDVTASMIADFKKAGQEIGGEAETYTNQLADAGVVLKDATGKVVTSGEQLQKFLSGTAAGRTIAPADVFVKTIARPLNAALQSLQAKGQYERTVTIPGQLGLQLRAQPLLAPETGILGSAGLVEKNLSPGTLSQLRTTLTETKGLQGQLNAAGEAGIGALRAQVAQYNPENVAEFDKQLQTATDLGTQIAGLQTKIATIQMDQSAKQFANQMRIAKRELSDALGLAGQVGGSAFGQLQRQDFFLQRQSQQIGFQLSQRQINFSIATAGFTANGMTGEEVAARQQEAKIQAQFAQAQLDIEKQRFDISLQMFNISSQRAVEDAKASRDLLQASYNNEKLMQAIVNQIAIKEQLQSQAMQRVQSIVAQAGSSFDTVLSNATEYVAQFGGTVLAAMNLIRSGMGLAPVRPKERPGAQQYASGVVGMTMGPTKAIVGEAGKESLVVLRNPSLSDVSSLGGGGSSTLNVSVNFGDVSVRSDADIDTIVDKTIRKMSDTLSLYGLRRP